MLPKICFIKTDDKKLKNIYIYISVIHIRNSCVRCSEPWLKKHCCAVTGPAATQSRGGGDLHDRTELIIDSWTIARPPVWTTTRRLPTRHCHHTHIKTHVIMSSLQSTSDRTHADSHDGSETDRENNQHQRETLHNISDLSFAKSHCLEIVIEFVRGV